MRASSLSSCLSSTTFQLGTSRVRRGYIWLVGLALFVQPLDAGEILDAVSVWRPEVEQLYHADIYPSEDAAINYLSQELRRKVASAEDVSFRLEDGSKLSRRLRGALESAELTIDQAGRSIRVWSETTDEHHRIRLVTNVDDEPINLAANFVNERWVTDDAAKEDRVVVRGTSPAESAISIAAQKHVLPRVLKHPRLRSTSRWERRIAEKRVRERLNKSPMIEDRFRQTFYKVIDDERHEAFSREALLLNLSKRNVNEIAQSVHRDVRRGRQIRSEAIGFSSAAVFVTFVLCWIGYTFFNRVTQGYYVWPIRLVTTGVLLATVTLAAGITISILNSL